MDLKRATDTVTSLCDARGCRREWEVRFRPGATFRNPDRDLCLCAEHQRELWEEIRARYEERTENPPAG